MSQAEEKILPWYRQFWFWFVFGPLIFIVALCAVTVTVAFRYSDDVVTDNYYKSGVMINQTLQQDEHAAQLGLNAALKFDQDTGEVLVHLQGSEQPKQLMLYLDNPVKSAKDQHILLQEISAGNYRGELAEPINYSWYLALVPETEVSKRKQAQWLLTGDINLANTHETLLQPRVK